MSDESFLRLLCERMVSGVVAARGLGVFGYAGFSVYDYFSEYPLLDMSYIPDRFHNLRPASHFGVYHEGDVDRFASLRGEPKKKAKKKQKSRFKDKTKEVKKAKKGAKGFFSKHAEDRFDEFCDPELLRKLTGSTDVVWDGRRANSDGITNDNMMTKARLDRFRPAMLKLVLSAIVTMKGHFNLVRAHTSDYVRNHALDVENPSKSMLEAAELVLNEGFWVLSSLNYNLIRPATYAHGRFLSEEERSNDYHMKTGLKMLRRDHRWDNLRNP